jgi:hypothetical protein
MFFNEVFDGKDSFFPGVFFVWKITGNDYNIHFGFEFEVNSAPKFIVCECVKYMVDYCFGQDDTSSTAC